MNLNLMATIKASIEGCSQPWVCLFDILDNIIKKNTNTKKIEVHSRYRDDGFIHVLMKVTGMKYAVLWTCKP